MLEEKWCLRKLMKFPKKNVSFDLIHLSHYHYKSNKVKTRNSLFS